MLLEAEALEELYNDTGSAALAQPSISQQNLPDSVLEVPPSVPPAEAHRPLDQEPHELPAQDDAGEAPAHEPLPLPPPIPAAAPRRQRLARGQHQAAAGVWYYEGGKISFYPMKHCFEAVCFNRAHGPLGACVMTRTSRGRLSHGVETAVAGRSLGFLALWLAKHADVGSKEAHRSKAALQAYTHEARLAARRLLLSTEAGRVLSHFERAQHEGEDLEPEALRGIVYLTKKGSGQGKVTIQKDMRHEVGKPCF